MDTYVNRNGVTINTGDYWVMESKPNMFQQGDESWVMKIITVQKNSLVPVQYVNWKRKGHGYSYSRTTDDFGSIANLRPATEEERLYFDKRYPVNE